MPPANQNESTGTVKEEEFSMLQFRMRESVLRRIKAQAALQGRTIQEIGSEFWLSYLEEAERKSGKKR